jgi:hypothetical protein
MVIVENIVPTLDAPDPYFAASALYADSGRDGKWELWHIRARAKASAFEAKNTVLDRGVACIGNTKHGTHIYLLDIAELSVMLRCHVRVASYASRWFLTAGFSQS